MTRPLALSLLLVGGALLLIPSAPAMGVEVDIVDVDAAEVRFEGVPAPLLGDLRLDSGLVTAPPLSVEVAPAPASGPAAVPAAQQAPRGLTPEGQRVAAAATAATGLALLAGLLAHHWGKLGAAGLLMPLFSRINSNHLLDNEVRHRVHAAVEANPGVTIKEVTELCHIGWGTAVYHLKRLEAERLVVSERNRQFRRFYKNGGGIVNGAKAAYGELKNPTSARIAHAIVESPGRCQKEVCAAVGISAPLAHKYLSRLAEAGLVDAQREWKTVKYFPTTKLEDLLQTARPVSVETTVSALPVAA
jgi:DNA-binding MarR family transcriptional regulator